MQHKHSKNNNTSLPPPPLLAIRKSPKGNSRATLTTFVKASVQTITSPVFCFLFKDLRKSTESSPAVCVHFSAGSSPGELKLIALPFPTALWFAIAGNVPNKTDVKHYFVQCSSIALGGLFWAVGSLSKDE